MALLLGDPMRLGLQIKQSMFAAAYSCNTLNPLLDRRRSPRTKIRLLKNPNYTKTDLPIDCYCSRG
jgi:hypothetical protein